MKQKNLELFNLFLSACENKNYSAATLKTYSNDLMKYINWLETAHPFVEIVAVTSAIISEYLDFLSIGGRIKSASPLINLKTLIANKRNPQVALKKKTKVRLITVVKSFYRTLISRKIAPKLIENPVNDEMHHIKIKEEDVRHTKMISDDDYYKVITSTSNPKHRLILMLMYYGGLRLNEVCRIEKSNLDFRNRIITCIRKGGKVHHLPLIEGERIFPIIARYLERYPNSTPYLFVSQSGKTLTSDICHQIIMKLLKRNGIKGISPHSFRKACATNLYYTTKNIFLVSQYLNHSDIKTTQIYLDPTVAASQNEPIKLQFMNATIRYKKSNRRVSNY